MDCDKCQPPSVIEKLMGLDTQPIQQPVQKRQRQRVLSENYLQKTASLQYSQKRLHGRTCSTMMQVGEMDHPSKTDYQTCWSESMFISFLRDLQDTSSHSCHIKVAKPLKPPKFEDCMETKVCGNAMKPQKKRKDSHSKPSKGRFSIEFNRPEKEKLRSSDVLNDKLKAPKNTDDLVSSFPGSRTRKHADLRSSVKENWMRTQRSLIRPRAHCDTNWYLIAEEANRSAPSGTGLHTTEYNGFSTPCKSVPVSTNLIYDCTVPQDDHVTQSSSNESETRRCNKKNVFEERNVVCDSIHESSSSVDSARLKDCEISSMIGDSMSAGLAMNQMALATQTEDTFGSNATLMECLLHATDEEASHSLSDDSLATCQSPEPLSPTSSEEVSRCSPISVLDSLSKEGIPSTMDCFMNGSSHLYEVHSEGPGMIVSSDEDNRQEPVDTTEDNVELSPRSYLVSVLDKAFGRGDVNCTIWPCSEDPIDIHVFQNLEEKYGRLATWPRSERKLLFDFINLGLNDIAKYCTGIRQIPSRLIAGWTRKDIEEILWKLIAIQDKEATKDKEIYPVKGKNSTAMKGKKSNAIKCEGVKDSTGDSSFFELEDYMDEIIIDIEQSLLDDLVSDCVNEVSL